MKFINKLKNIYKTLKYLLKSDQYIVYYTFDNNLHCETKNDENISGPYYRNIIDDLKTKVIQYQFGGDINKYSEHLEEYDTDLFNAYKDLNYLDIKQKCTEQEFQYFKDMNTPGMWIDGNTAYRRWMHLEDLRKQCKMMEVEMRT